MTFHIKIDILLYTFLCSLLGILMTSQSTETDIYCLKSLKNSIQDPNNFFQSWNFNNETEGFICDFVGVVCWHPHENRVLNLELSNMGLKGQFPRGIVNCSSMTGLDLSNNEFSGTIPSDISILLRYVTKFDLSNNKFSGEIPISFANCTYLNSLKLNNNMLSGEIPKQLESLPRLKEISFANNYLSGSMPVFSGKVNFSYANNNGVCGGSLRRCSLARDMQEDFHQSFKNGLIVGYVFSIISSVMITFMFYSKCARWMHHLKKRKNNYLNKAIEVGKYIYSIISMMKQMVVNQIHELLPMRLTCKENKEISALCESLTSTIWLEELRDATDCFTIDNAIGVGKMGMMYEGFMPNGKERILTYEYMSNGRLSKWLRPLESEVIRLKWHDRVKIALGIARGLSWLHHTCDLCIVHFNICSECILLDENFEPKISNFGEAKFMNPSIEDHLGVIFKVNDGKKDVYDFGSVLFELIMGKPYDELSHSYDTTNMCGNPLSFYNVIDKSLTGEGLDKEVCTLLKIACECVKPLPNQRPTMLEVYNNISNLRKEQDGYIDEIIEF
ncbi:unnamed protein product [Lathyrus sativus]|nr:unnamed protein product [Lathyrus sativus]